MLPYIWYIYNIYICPTRHILQLSSNFCGLILPSSHFYSVTMGTNMLCFSTRLKTHMNVCVGILLTLYATTSLVFICNYTGFFFFLLKIFSCFPLSGQCWARVVKGKHHQSETAWQSLHICACCHFPWDFSENRNLYSPTCLVYFHASFNTPYNIL